MLASRIILRPLVRGESQRIHNQSRDHDSIRSIVLCWVFRDLVDDGEPLPYDWNVIGLVKPQELIRDTTYSGFK